MDQIETNPDLFTDLSVNVTNVSYTSDGYTFCTNLLQFFSFRDLYKYFVFLYTGSASNESIAEWIS